jgi:hypothetical protein
MIAVQAQLAVVPGAGQHVEPEGCTADDYQQGEGSPELTPVDVWLRRLS